MDPLNISAKFEVRSFAHSWGNRGYSKNLGSPWIRPRSLFSQIFKGLLFVWTFWIYLPNLKFVALPIPEIIGGLRKFGKNLYMPTLPFLSKFYRAFVRMDPMNIPAKFEVRSFIHSWDNRVYFKNLGSSSIRPLSLFSQNFKGLLFGWTLRIYLPSLKFVALPIPEIIGCTSKIWGVPWLGHPSYSPKFLKGFCSHGPCEYTCQVWSLSLYPFLR